MILNPKTASGPIKRAILPTYPEAMQLYRHMEPCGVPKGYEMWEKLVVFRSPGDRLKSIYSYLKTFDKVPELVHSVSNKSFAEWLTSDNHTFPSAYVENGKTRFHPVHMTSHNIPTTRKSQWYWCRPDLGIKMFEFDKLDQLEDYLEIRLVPGINASVKQNPGMFTMRARSHMRKWFKWDLEMLAVIKG